MNRDNASALVMGIAVVALIVGFAIYFNSPSLNNATNENGADTPQKPNPIALGGAGNSNITIDKSRFKQAPEFQKISGYLNINSNDGNNPFTLTSLEGKVVLVDFWTYSCINCIRTFPHLVDWNNKYADDGLVIVGIHTPEFEFEKNIENVKSAAKKYGLTYPVIQDNDKGTWNAYDNRYWPHKYLIDAEGYLRYDHIGEGGYQETESVIQSLLSERAAALGKKTDFGNSSDTNNTLQIINPELQSVDFSQIKTPELYLGYDFARHPLGNPEGLKPNQVVNYSISAANPNFEPNIVYLDGEWKNNADHIELQGDTGKIILTYYAKAINIVAGGKGGGIVSEDGKVLSSNNANKSLGLDLKQDGSFTIDGQRLYNLALHDDYGARSIVIDAKGKGFQLYTFTFG
jgi:thiol-disulfide isomerase/thioredoxin